MCPHNEFEFVREKLRKFLHGWRVFEVKKCIYCKREETFSTNFMVYGRGKNEEKYEIKKLDE